MRVGTMVGGGARLVRTQPKALALWALLYLAIAGAIMALVWPMMAELADFQRQMMAAEAGRVGPPPAPTGFVGATLLMQLLSVVAMAAIFAAAVRAVARGGDDRFGFLRLGMDEVRLIGLALLLWLIAAGGFIGFALAATLVTAGLYAAFGASAMVALLPLWLVALALLLWAEVRISLAGAFTVLRGRIVLVEAWRATGGRFWTLLGAYGLIGLVYVVATLVTTAIVQPGLFALYAEMIRNDPQAVLAAQQALFAQMFGPRMIVAMAVGTLVNTVLVGWLFGAIATAAVAIDAEAHGMAARP